VVTQWLMRTTNPIYCLLPRIMSTLRLSELQGQVHETGHGRTVVVLDLIDSWAGHVLRLFRESTGQVPDSWGAHDYIAALYVRDRLGNALKRMTNEIHRDDPFSVQTIDSLFVSFTSADVEHQLRRFQDELPGDPWWWQRIPTTGPVATQLRAARAKCEG
jgi:hypothetical protein